MIIYSKKKYVPIVSEMMTIDLANGYHIITTRTCYNQGVILSYKYGENYTNERFQPVESKIDYSDIENILPPELKFFSSLIGLVDIPDEDIPNLTIEDKLKAISIILASSYPLQFFKEDPDKRLPIRFVKSVITEGDRMWKDVIRFNCIEYDNITDISKKEVSNTSSSNFKEAPKQETKSGIDSFFGNMKKKIAEKKETMNNPEQNSAPSTKPKSEPVKPKEEDEADFLISGLLNKGD